MNKKYMEIDEIFVNRFDVEDYINKFAEDQIGVNVNRIYLQIAKFDQNPKRKTEVQVLKNAAMTACNKNHYDSKYVAMKLEDVILCFGNNFKSLPKTTFSCFFISNLFND